MLIHQQPAAVQVDLQRHVSASGEALRFGAIADMPATWPAAMRARAARAVVARRRVGSRLSSLDARRVCDRARAQLPGIATYLDCSTVRGTLQVAWPMATADAAVSPPGRCVALVRELTAGAAPGPDDLRPTDCIGRPRGLVYDAETGLARAGADLPAGAVVRRPPDRALARVQPGQTLYLVARVGPVAIERQVRAVRAARPGAAILVQGDAGPAFLAPGPGS